MSKPFEPPKHTQFSNDAIDYIMREVSPNAWKIITVAIRKTYGWHKQSDVISLSQFQELTGIGSRSTLVSAIKEVTDKKILVRRKNGISYEYELNREYIVQKSDQYRNCTSTSTETVPVASTETVHTKERKKKNKEKDLVDGIIELSQMPGVKKQIRLEGIQSRIGVALNINVTWSRWEKFIRYADKQEQEHKQTVEVFMDWLKAKPNFDITYWPPDKMQEVWPQAFTDQKNWTPIPDVEKTQAIIEEKEKVFVKKPANIKRPTIHQPQPKGA